MAAMKKALAKLKLKTCRYVDRALKRLPFYEPIQVGARLRWKVSATGKPLKLPKTAGLYLLSPPSPKKRPIYIGEAGNLSRRLHFHFSKSKSSNFQSTFNKSCRRKGFMCNSGFRMRFIEIPFGRKDMEVYLKKKFKVR
jgi:hypothetical protein